MFRFQREHGWWWIICRILRNNLLAKDMVIKRRSSKKRFPTGIGIVGDVEWRLEDLFRMLESITPAKDQKN